ncbi:MAG: PA0069 family radical SAM protein, partial [bacterium]
MTNGLPTVKGRGTVLNPENRFERLKLEIEPECYEQAPGLKVKTEYFVDQSREILAKNTSPDVPFTYSLNPYRGCEHGCIYCYARPTHEYFGFSAGLDFETKILVKEEAPRLLANRFRRKSWLPQVVALSGNTDCYQPIEKQLQLTRRCLEVFLQYRNPVSVITKNALVLRDLDLLQDLAGLDLVRVTLSITTLDPELARKMEPRAASPKNRLQALQNLALAGIPTKVNLAPVIPGLTDHEIPAILEQAAACGAKRAAYILLRLPFSVKELFVAWLQAYFPHRAGKVRHAIQESRGGELSDARFGSRLRGEGVRADVIARIFELTCQRLALNANKIELATEHFRR